MEIRRAKVDDIEQIKKLIDINFDEVIAKYHSPHVVSKFKNHNTVESLKSQLNWKKIFVADDGGCIVGTGAFVNFGTKDLPKFSISNLYVLPNLHGKGIGTQLITVLFAAAKEIDASFFHVPSSKNAIPFYEHYGFVVDEIQLETEDEITWMTMPLYYK